MVGGIYGRMYGGTKKMKEKRDEGRTQVMEEQREDGTGRRPGMEGKREEGMKGNREVEIDTSWEGEKESQYPCEDHVMHALWSHDVSLTTPTTTSRIMEAIMTSITCTRGTRSGQRLCASLYSPNPARTNMYVVSSRLRRRNVAINQFNQFNQ